MRIGVDLDGVIVDLATPLIAEWNHSHKAKISFNRMTEYLGSHLLGVSEKYFWRWWSKIVSAGIFYFAQPYPGAKDFLLELRNQGDEIVIITSRRIIEGDHRPLVDTINWLKKEAIPYDELHFVQHKHYVLADIYLEDDSSQVKKLLQTGKPVLIPVRPWTKKIKAGRGCQKFTDYDEALSLIEKERGR